MRIAHLVVTTTLFLTPANAQDTAYQLGFKFGIPPGFEVTDEELEEEGRDGTIFRSPEGGYMEVWKISLDGRSFSETVREHLAQSEGDGWTLTYKKLAREWISYSGIKDERIRYVRAIVLCNDSAAFFLIDYDQTKKTAYDPIILRMVRSLKANCS